MIVYVRNQDEESHASPKLFDVGLDVSAVNPQGIDNLGVRMFARIGWVGPQKRCGRHIRNSPATVRPVEPPNQRDRHTVAVHQSRIRHLQPGRVGKLHGEHFAFGHRPLIRHAGKLAYPQLSIIINYGAFGTQAAQ